MVRSRADAGSKVSLTGGRKKANRPNVPRPGHIYWATCSIRRAMLEVTKALTGSTYPLSSAMASDLKQVCDDGPRRPCVVLRVNPQTRTATLVPMATYKGQPIAELAAHYQHFSVSVGETRPWPSPDSYVLQPSPSWPLSRRKPCYALAGAIEVNWDRIHDKYIWPVRKESELDRALQGAQAATSDTLGSAPPAVLDGEEVISSFVVETEDLLIYGDVIENRAQKIKNKSPEEILTMQKSYTSSRQPAEA